MQIYAGRNIIPDFTIGRESMAKAKQNSAENLHKKNTDIDSVSLSKEGLEYFQNLGIYNSSGRELHSEGAELADFEEINTQLHTKICDYSCYFYSEIQAAIDEEWEGKNLERTPENSAMLIEKAYETVRRRIVEEFSKDDRITTYVIDKETGERREETVDDRLQELERAYKQHDVLRLSSEKIELDLKKWKKE